MSDVTKQVAHLAIDTADGAAAAALDVLGKTADLAQAGVEAPIHVAGKGIDAALAEAKGLQSKLTDLLRSIADAVTAPLP